MLEGTGRQITIPGRIISEDAYECFTALLQDKLAEIADDPSNTDKRDIEKITAVTKELNFCIWEFWKNNVVKHEYNLMLELFGGPTK